MEELTLKKDAQALAQQNVLAYFESHDMKYVAEDAVFRNLSTGQEHKGKADIGAMLHFMYHIAFDAKAEVKNFVITEDKASVEALFRGRHIGEIAGIAATNKEVSVPFSVFYDLKDGIIQGARIYMLTEVMQQQLGVAGTAPKPKVSYLVRDIFQLKFGHFRDAKQLLEEAAGKKMLPEAQQTKVLTDFTGDAYRLIFEEGYEHLSDYELSLTSSMHTEEWQEWYERFKPHVESSHREILKQIM